MSIHIGAKKGEISDKILLSGDPLRAKYIAEKYFKNPVCYNEVRNMFGFTGDYKGKRISVQGTGMGVPSTAIYVNELLSEYEVKTIVRIGTCGSIQKEVKTRDMVIGMCASSDSGYNDERFNGRTFAPCADFGLLMKSYELAVKAGFKPHVGNIVTTDDFYYDSPQYWQRWAQYGALAIEMESTAIYTLASKFKVAALTILTVSDNFITKEIVSAEERQASFMQMVEVALELV